VIRAPSAAVRSKMGKTAGMLRLDGLPTPVHGESHARTSPLVIAHLRLQLASAFALSR
jgi:hypothetical protein